MAIFLGGGGAALASEGGAVIGRSGRTGADLVATPAPERTIHDAARPLGNN
jgi:hypothetical protein